MGTVALLGERRARHASRWTTAYAICMDRRIDSQNRALRSFLAPDFVPARPGPARWEQRSARGKADFFYDVWREKPVERPLNNRTVRSLVG